jgi:hypothetical protein
MVKASLEGTPAGLMTFAESGPRAAFLPKFTIFLTWRVI